MEAVTIRPNAIQDALKFLRLWLKQPRSIGAIAPSSANLSRAIAGKVDFRKPGAVVELGGGTGRITRALIENAGGPEDIVVVEREASLCALLSARFPNARVLRGDARDLGKLLDDAGIGPIKAVVSGLPLLSMPDRVRSEIIDEVFAVLPADGVFVQFTYGLKDPAPREAAELAGITGRRSGWILRNLPPAAIWLYQRGDHAVSPPLGADAQAG